MPLYPLLATLAAAPSPAMALILLAIGVAVVLGMILVLRLNAFFALISAALAVSLLAPGELGQKVVRVTEAFGTTAGKIGIAIAMAAVIGSAMTASGAADRIVGAFLGFLGERRAATALAASGFVLSIPVFFDTVFYLLCPLARSTYRRTGRHYLKYLLALGAGGTATHTLVPPTPGPLFAAEELGVDIGLMILVGIIVGVPSTIAGLLYASWLDPRLKLATPPTSPAETAAPATENLPGLGLSLAPIVLPVLLIAGNAVVSQIVRRAAAVPDGSTTTWQRWAIDAEPALSVVGNPNLALILSAAIALLTYVGVRRPSRSETSRLVEESLLSAGAIVLITSAGGAFGAMLGKAGVGEAVNQLVATDNAVASFSLLLLAFGVSSLLKLSQGSTTVAIITASGMINAMIGDTTLDFHRVYLASAIGCGAMVAAWMNDSGFWVFCKMGGLSESEGLRAWTPLTAIMGFAGMAATIAMAAVWPLI
jgi:GntP family gluconate:H+ symporter